jgi:uncharacterized membrane protein YbhN (UPF0104 family)
MAGRQRKNGASPINRPTKHSMWTWVRLAGGAAILAVLVARVGTGPFVDAVHLTNVAGLLAAAAVTAVTTVASAWRWRLVASGLGTAVSLPTAIGAYYRSQFLNSTLPGGVLGDVHRAVAHGRDAGDMSRSVRAVGWERSAGQVVQIVLTVIALLLLPSPLHSSLPAIVAGALEVALILLLVGFVLRGTRGLPARIVRAVSRDVREGLLARNLWPGILAASTVAVTGYVVIFLVAARTAGVPASASEILPLALIVLLASAVPTNIAGWGPREGAAAWAFGAAGLGAAQGATVAVVYGVMVLVATLPGAVLLLVDWLAAGRRRAAIAAHRPEALRPVEEASRG